MTDITLGQSINGALTPNDTKFTGTNAVYDRYDFIGLDDFRQLSITITRPNLFNPFNVELRDAVTDRILAEAIDLIGGGKLSLSHTTYPGIKYIILVSGGDGAYTVSTVDGGKATSIVSTSKVQTNLGVNSRSIAGVGTVGAGGKFFPLATSPGYTLADVALAPDGQFYGVSGDNNGNFLYRIDPKAYRDNQITPAGGALVTSIVKNIQGSTLAGTIDAIEFANNKLYALDRTTTGDKLYTIDPASLVATLVSDLPPGLLNKGGDLVYDATKNRFLVTAEGTVDNDALWQIPLTNPAGATKIGQIGFRNVTAIDFEGGQLTGISKNPDGTASKIAIDPTTGAGTLSQAISGVIDISGAATIFSSGNSGAVSLTDLKKDPGKYMGSIRDYDGNNLGGASSWKLLGDVDIQGDGDLESILVNPAIERFASVGSVAGNVDFSKYGLNGDTRVVGIYIDPTLKNQPQNIGGPFDSQRRFQNDLKIDNLKVLAAGDYDKDGFQDLYFKLGDGSAVLRALMFKDGNIQYANYQSKSDLATFMTANNVNSSVWGGWI